MSSVHSSLGAVHFVAWLGQAQPLLYHAKALVAVYSSGWACPSHAQHLVLNAKNEPHPSSLG